MALQIHFSSSFTGRTRHLHQTLLFSPAQPSFFTVRSQKPSESSNSTTNVDGSDPASTTPQKSSSPGVGFGSSVSSNLSKKDASAATSKKQKGKRERASIIRRSPVEKPTFVSEIDEARAKELRKNESAFLLAWLGFGAVILVEGIFIAASGFLPEELDKFCVNYLYPSFTPTVFVFVAGTVVYGVYKYLQNEKIGGQE